MTTQPEASATPRTDKLVVDLPHNSLGAIIDLMQFARMLEREVAELRRDAEARLEALKLALEAMDYMGDVLNDMDVVFEEDEDAVMPAFNAVRSAIAAALGGKDE